MPLEGRPAFLAEGGVDAVRALGGPVVAELFMEGYNLCQQN